MSAPQATGFREDLPGRLPQCCSPLAFALLSRQVPVINSPDALLQGAVAISMHQLPDVDPAQVDAQLQRYADLVRSRVKGSQQQALLAHLHEVLFEEEGFVGNTDDYYNPNNSYLPTVLATKRGLPITLSLVYKTVAERLGLRVWGVGLPGHFLVAMEQERHDEPMLIDPFAAGRILTIDEARQRMTELFGGEMEWSDDLLQPASNRHWLTRMLQNLLHIFGSSDRYADVAAILELEMLLWPAQGHLQRDLGLVLARIGLARPASIWLNEYLKNNPDDPQRGDLKQLLQVLAA
ncbi:MAG TPA: transglutaminase-like domain-containing protein [Tepidisphaeraceae bacterium]|nr:transglutaminase-like domain-containing protein [Tepidisphaeraceae bacterium]